MKKAELRAIRVGEETECPDCRDRIHRGAACQTCGGKRRVIWQRIEGRLAPTRA